MKGEYFLDGTTPEQAARAPRSGTPPYASVMLLNAIDVIVNVHKSGLNRRSVIHDAVHDMESFFWPSRGTQAHADRAALSHCLLLLRWRHCHPRMEQEAASRQWTAFESEILVHVHEYFAPLKPVLLQWWHLLLLAYEFHGYEYHNIHDHVIASPGEGSRRPRNQVPMEPSERTAEAEAEAEALKKREDFVHRVVYAGLDPPGVGDDFKSSTVLDVSPESQRQPLRSQLPDNAPSSPTPARPASKKTKLERKT
ncbi:hypothetical protein BD414DRAFT_503890 [Trametes punicea]|nr:hypothetical protein BD414DRAFT_503890 [Trametes punicea]